MATKTMMSRLSKMFAPFDPEDKDQEKGAEQKPGKELPEEKPVDKTGPKGAKHDAGAEPKDKRLPGDKIFPEQPDQDEPVDDQMKNLVPPPMPLGAGDPVEDLAAAVQVPPIIGQEFGVSQESYYTRYELTQYSPDALTSKKGFKIYEQMYLDDQIHMAITAMKLMRLSSGYEVIEASQDALDIEIADFVADNLVKIEGGINDTLFNIMGALEMGWSLNEKVWDYFSVGPWAGKVRLKALKSKNPQWFNPSVDDFNNLTGVVMISPPAYGRKLPADKFIVYSFMKRYENIFGTARTRALYDWWWIKQVTRRALGLFLEKFGNPLAVGKYPTGMTPAQQGQLLRALQQLKITTALTLPDGCEVDFVEASKQGAEAFLQTIEKCDQQIVKLILGQTMSSGTSSAHSSGAGGGSGGQSGASSGKAGGSMAEKVMDMYILYIGNHLSENPMAALIKEMVDYNWTGVINYPTFRFKPMAQEDLTKNIELFIKAATSKAGPADPVIPFGAPGGGKPPFFGKGKKSEEEEEEKGAKPFADLPFFKKGAKPEGGKEDEAVDAEEQEGLGEGADGEQTPGAPLEDGMPGKSKAIVNATPEDEQFIRTALGFPSTQGKNPLRPNRYINKPVPALITPRKINPLDLPQAGYREPTPSGPGMAANYAEEVKFKLTRKPNQFERKVDFAESFRIIEQDGAAVLAADAASVIRKAVEKLKTQAKRAMGSPSAVRRMQMPYRGELAQVLRDGLQSISKDALKQARSELKASKAKKFADVKVDLEAMAPEEVLSYIKDRSFTMAGDVSDEVLKKVKQQMYNGIKSGASYKDIVYKIENAIAPYIDLTQAMGDLSGARLMTTVRTASAEAYNETRKAAFMDPELGGFVQAFQLSAIMDDRTTEWCEDLDQLIYKASNPIWDILTPPLWYNCRTVLIPITQVDGWDGIESDEPETMPPEGFK